MSNDGRQGQPRHFAPQNDLAAAQGSSYCPETGLAQPLTLRSGSGNVTQPAPSQPRTSRINLPPCASCGLQPREPHAVYCCGSMYCHHCLVRKMTDASERGEQAICDKCRQPMGDPGPTRNKRGSEARAASSTGPDSPSGPNAKSARLGSETSVVNQKLSQPTSLPPMNSYPDMLRNNAGPPGPIPPFFSGPPGFGFQSNVAPTSFPSTGFQQTNVAPNPLGTGQNPSRPMPPHFNSGQNVMQPSLPLSGGPTHGPGSALLSGGQPSLPLSSSSLSGGPGFSSGLPSVGRDNSAIADKRQHAHRSIREGDPNRMEIPSDSMFMPTGGPLAGGPGYVYQKPIPAPNRLTSAGAQQAQMAKSAALINDMDEILPKPPSPYTAEEKKIKEMKDIAAKKLTYEKKENTVIGPTCGVCWEYSRKPVTTYCCEKIYCYTCLTESLRMRPRCPNCNRNLPSSEFPNPYKMVELKEPVKPPATLNTVAPIVNVDGVLEKFKGLDEFTLSTFIKGLSEIREEKYKERKNDSLRTLSVGLGDFVKKCKFDIQTLQRQLEAAMQDKKFLDGGYSRDCSLYGGVFSAISSLSSSSSGFNSSGGPLPSILSEPIDPIIQARDERLKNHFDAFCTSYHDIFNKYTVYSNEEPNMMSQNRINAMIEVADGITKYAKATKICNLNYDCEPNPAMSIISSLEFDTIGERFVVAGVTKKIKVFNFENFIENPNKSHIPLTQLVCQSKISNVSWNPVEYQTLASSDYDGHVSIWNVEAGKVVKSYREHEKRCWTVHFNNQDPKIMASGSDDAKVKIWNLNCDRAVAQIEAKVNVCCVYFSPHDRNQLIFGSADHGVHLYDIRNVGKPVNIFRGHRKAVSYVRYIGTDQIVSASTDSSLRVWNISEGRCTKVLKGHTNEKNFVGLSGNGDHVICGSENARAFIYYKGLADPLLSYTVGKENNPEDDSEGFVSSVCWKKDSDHVLVANSLGKVHLLQVS